MVTRNHCGARVINANPERASMASLSFSGCGFLCIYHAGVCAAIKEYAPQLLQNRICGASAGSIIAAGAVCNVCISEATSLFLSVVSEARSFTFGALNRDFDLMKLVRTKLNVVLPKNAHEVCTGRLQISVTRFRDMQNVILSEFETKEELIDAICCSCFIPVYGGFIYPTFRGEIYIDGGASNNQPVIDSNTITVSPFSGESDICPSDMESASLFEWNFAGTSIRLTANNLYRAAVCLFPPSTEECAMMCRNGFKDALKFLISNGFVSNAVFLSVEADLPGDLNEISGAVPSFVSSKCNTFQEKPNSNQKLFPSVFSLAPITNNTTFKKEKQSERIDAVLMAESSQLPQSMQSAFDEAMKKDGFLSYIRSFRIVKIAQYMTMPFTATIQLFKFCQCLSSWLATRIAKHIIDDWCSVHVRHIVSFIMHEIHLQEVKVSARLSQQLAVTEFEFSGVGQRPVIREQLLNIALSPEAIQEREALRNMDKLLSNSSSTSSNKVNSTTRNSVSEKSSFSSPASTTIKNERSMLESDDTLSQIIEHATLYDAALAFYYISTDKRLRICEIFDVNHPEKRHFCHSTHDG